MTELKRNAIREYFLYGDIIATIVSDKTGNKYRVHVSHVKDDTYYCEHLPENGVAQFAGIYESRYGVFYLTDKYIMVTVAKDMPMWLRAIRYTMYHLNNLPKWIHVYATHCASCGRKLTSARSQSRGFGEECYKKLKR